LLLPKAPPAAEAAGSWDMVFSATLPPDESDPPLGREKDLIHKNRVRLGFYGRRLK
jgi:hypothetical protein